VTSGGDDALSVAVRDVLRRAEGFPLSVRQIVERLSSHDGDDPLVTERPLRSLGTTVRVKLVKWERYKLVERFTVEGFGCYWRWLGPTLPRARSDNARGDSLN
jgi:hypothetical protein